MTSKTLVYLGLFIGSTVGSYLPTFFSASLFSGWSLIGGAIGGLIGIWIGYKGAQNYLDL